MPQYIGGPYDGDSAMGAMGAHVSYVPASSGLARYEFRMATGNYHFAGYRAEADGDPSAEMLADRERLRAILDKLDPPG